MAFSDVLTMRSSMYTSKFLPICAANMASIDGAHIPQTERHHLEVVVFVICHEGGLWGVQGIHSDLVVA